MKERDEQLQIVPPVVQPHNNNIETIQAKPTVNKETNKLCLDLSKDLTFPGVSFLCSRI